MPEIALRPVARGDRTWLLRVGWSLELAGSQYHWVELPLQAAVAPLRALLGPVVPAAVIEVDGRRAGYIGRSPLSGNLEYFLASWARDGVGKQAIAEFLAHHRSGDRRRRFVVSRRNPRSLAALRGAFHLLGWTEGVEYAVSEGRRGWSVWVERGQRGHDTGSRSMPAPPRER
jgi:hypothetical protein